MNRFMEEEKQLIIETLIDTVDKLSSLWEEEALDRDQTEGIAKEFLKRLDWVNGNSNEKA